MASTTSVPIEQHKPKPSFAKVAASPYKPHTVKDAQPTTTDYPVASLIPVDQSSSVAEDRSVGTNSPQVRIEHNTIDASQRKFDNIAMRTGQWADVAGQQPDYQPDVKDTESEKPRPAITLVKSLLPEDNTTQLSSSDGSGKPPSLDGKSVASATTFALDEKESIRPDDSASLRAVEEEDITSPPDSVVADSRVGSDSGIARAFRDQLHEIAVMGPVPQRGAPPGRLPTANANSSHTLYDPSQPQISVGRPMSQPVVNGMPNVVGPHTLPAVPDDKLIEALESPRDRLFVLKLEQDFIDFVKDSRETELSLPNCNTFYRMLAHRLADYYLLGHVVDNTMTGVKITRTAYCRIPPPLSGLPVSSKNTNTPPVDLTARKIMRREDGAKSGTNTTTNSEGPSKTTSEVGGGSGSEGGNEGNGSDGKDKSALTREEREARYREARQRIFGSAENDDSEIAEGAMTAESKDMSRSSSASGKKKNKKQRNYDDDFEARSRFNAYYPQQYPSPGFNNDQTVYYGGFPGQMHNPQYPVVNANASPPSTYNSGYPSMMPQDPQGPYGWPGQQYPSTNGPINYPGYGPTHNGYDLSTEFQRGMQSFQSSNVPSQVTPKMSHTPMASYQETYQQPIPMNPAWPQINQQPSYPMNYPHHAQTSPSSRPMSAPNQGPPPNQYLYGQFPNTPYNGKPGRNQHPLPGSFNRQQFNPQSQAFIPGGRNVAYQMPPNVPPMPPQNINGYPSYQLPMTNQMAGQISRPSPPVAHQQTFGSPRSIHNSIAVAPGVHKVNPAHTPQIANSQTATTSNSSQSSSTSIPAQSTIAKWGTPSHLPPKPPAPAPQSQPPKFGLPTHTNFSPAPRLPGNMGPGYITNTMHRSNPGPPVPNINTT